MNEIIVSGQLPVLALRGLVVFPKQTVHFDVAREKSVKALEAAMERDLEKAFAAFRNDPLVSISDADARKLFNEMVENTKEYLQDWMSLVKQMHPLYFP